MVAAGRRSGMFDAQLVPKSTLALARLALAASIAAMAIAGCKGPEVIGKPGSTAPGAGGGAGGSGPGGGAPSPGGSPFALPDGGADLAPATPGNNPIGEQCAETGAQAEQV